MTELNELRISDVRRDTSEAIVLTFDVPRALRKEFEYKHGQYLTLSKVIDGEDIRRAYSICSGSNREDGLLRVAIKLVKGGVFSTWAHRCLKAQDKILALPPTGDFTNDLDPSGSRIYCCIAAGSGITPILSIVKTILATEHQSRVVMLYGNKRVSTIMFLEEINGLKNQYMERLQVHHVLTREPSFSKLLSGRMDGKKALQIIHRLKLNTGKMEFFVCGPNEMSSDIIESLLGSGVDKSSIYSESFGHYVTKKKLEESSPLLTQTSCVATLKYDGRIFEVKFDPQKDTILEAALDQGVTLPHSCKAGACATCRGLLLEGQVVMDKSHALDNSALDANYILTCQARPISETIVVDLDQKK